MQGMWLTNTDSKVLHSRANLEQALGQLKELGFDTIYPSVWHRGHTLYPSPIAEKHTGHATLPQPEYANRDCLAELLEIAHDLGLRVVAWWEYGMMLPPTCTMVERYPGSLTFTNTGDRLRRKATNAQLDTAVWLNPCDPFVAKVMGDLLADLVERYRIDAVQFDDHWAWPIELGFDPATQAFYRQSQGGIWPLGNRISWADWSVNQMTDLFQQMVQRIKASRNSCQISLAPNPLRFSINNYRQNWQQWLGLIDELVVQVYRYDLASFQAEIGKPELQAVKEKTAIGILTGLKGKVQPPQLIQQQIAAMERAGYQGFSCFFYETAIDPTLVDMWNDLTRQIKHH
jgi:uncharacterized lipoprotein YddW (UPF0748 family)